MVKKIFYRLILSLPVLISLSVGAAHSATLYVSNFGNNTIEQFDTSGTPMVFATTGLSGPSGLAFDAAGNLYVSNVLNNTVRRFSPTGVDLGNFATTGLREPGSLAFGPVPQTPPSVSCG